MKHMKAAKRKEGNRAFSGEKGEKKKAKLVFKQILLRKKRSYPPAATWGWRHVAGGKRKNDRFK